jgi:hypothetical protein
VAKPRSMKRDIDKAKREKAAEKRERRQRPADDGAATGEVRPPVDEGEVLAQLGALHARFEAEEIDFEEFEQQKGELMALLRGD